MAPTFPFQGEPEYPRSVITFGQIETFLTLVEEGGPDLRNGGGTNAQEKALE